MVHSYPKAICEQCGKGMGCIISLPESILRPVFVGSLIREMASLFTVKIIDFDTLVKCQTI